MRPFERARFADGSLLQDFLDAAGLGLRADAFEQPGSQNESLGAEGVEVLRLLNLHHRRNLGQPAWSIAHGPHVRRLLDHGCGPVLTLPPAELDRFMEQWAESNRAVARDVLGDPTGRLFHADRKVDGTTTVQRLEPDRLDHYLALLEIPEEHHAPLRRLAEQEAAG
ncbi:hypothetical protein [Nocardioides sp. TF02-7]|uniref:hypothetical protein n=1 Tax=Nocardioides sp. TF02-7 TaxID=2917724 RepID=UPI001F05C6B6|nr:hypothetical protein [Nocardioides sp. TF02-7]UMG93047.1 hypothetical protein MF408_01500 [Nocardioides sp. TF02-7]